MMRRRGWGVEGRGMVEKGITNQPAGFAPPSSPYMDLLLVKSGLD
jgi:hypothetical protein